MKLLGIDIGGTNIRVGLVEGNELTKVESMLVRKDSSENEVFDDLFSLIRKFDYEKVEGIGVGVPSIVDVEKGIVYQVQNIPSWKKVHLKEILESNFKIPTYINNDANCFAVGEKYFGNVKDYKNIVGLIIGTGLGAGVIINNKLYEGANCGAGEFGEIAYKDKNYEYYCSGQYFLNEIGISGKELAKKAADKDSSALEIYRNYGENLGNAIKMIMYALDPEVIVLGGSVSKSFLYFKEQMWKSIKRFTYSKSAEKIKITVSEKENIAILGAAALYLNAKNA